MKGKAAVEDAGTLTELNRRVESARRVVAMTKGEAWHDLRAWVIEEKQRGIESLLAMEPARFQGPDGLALKEFCRGLQHAINAVSDIFENGVRAQEELNRRKSAEERGAGKPVAQRVG